MLKNKSHTPNPKSQTNSKLQIPEFLTSKFWLFGIWSLFIVCDLCIGYWDLTLYAQEEFVYDAKGRRDPFIPLVTPDGRLLKLEREEPPSGLLLEGIIYDTYGSSYAIVNGEIVKVSDKIGEYQVLKIEKNKVVLIKGGQMTEVELKEE